MLKSAVLDASVLVSAFLFPHSVPGQIYDLGRNDVYEIHLSEILLEEIRRALTSQRLLKSYPRTSGAIDDWLNDLQQSASMVTMPLPDIPPICRDPHDDHVIAAAVMTNAEVIVTGDADLLVLEGYQDIRIIKPRVCLGLLNDL